MLHQEAIIYIYDGSFYGMLCCIFMAFARGELPIDIVTADKYEPTFFAQRHIDTDEALAECVLTSFSKKISPRGEKLIKDIYLSCLEQSELHILNFLQLGYAVGSSCLNMLEDPRVDTLLKAQKHMEREAHSLLGFARFEDYDGKLVSQITPKNFVLPRIVPHFVERYNAESFLIYDKTHKTAFVYEGGKGEYIDNLDFTAPELSDDEREMHDLWRIFFNTVGIEGRKNLRCQMNFMPKRFWADLTEMR